MPRMQSDNEVICPHCGYQDPITSRYHEGNPYRCKNCLAIFLYSRVYVPRHITAPFNAEAMGGMEKLREVLKNEKRRAKTTD